MKVFIIHYKPLILRKKLMLEQLSYQNNILFANYDYEFIENLDKEELTINQLKKFNIINMANISLIYKHFFIYNKISQLNENNFLILEDDCILYKNFSKVLNNYINELPKDYDMLFLGSGCNLHYPKIIKNKHIYKVNHPATRCTDSILVNKKCCKKLVEYFNNDKNINKPIDFYLNDILKILDLNIYWCEPTIVKQGSEIGLYKSSLR